MSAPRPFPSPRLQPEPTDSLSVGSGDLALLARLRDGDEAAFETLFRSCYPMLCTFAHRLVGRADVAEDLVQESLLYLWDRRASLVLHAGLRPYLFSTVRNAAVSYLRHERVVERRAAEVAPLFRRPAPASDALVLEREARDAIRAAIARLPERCRVIFCMQRELGMTYGEVARTLAISPKTVDVQMGRALKSLRRMLGAHMRSPGRE